MKARLDRFGRIVVPKEIRDRHGLVPGSEVEVEDSPETIACISHEPPGGASDPA
jgi:AbrB family looped-hinge helix DNA binding protein